LHIALRGSFRSSWKADAKLVVRNFRMLFDPQEVFTDVHLGREADVVMHVFFAKSKGFRTAERKLDRIVTERTEVCRGENTERIGKVRDENRALLLVCIEELCRVKRTFRFGRELDLATGAYGFDKALDADADRSAGVAFVEL